MNKQSQAGQVHQADEEICTWDNSERSAYDFTLKQMTCRI